MNGHWDLIRHAYPKFTGRQDWLSAQHHAQNLIDAGTANAEELLQGVERYALFCAKGGVSEARFVLTPSKFFSAADRPWRQEWQPPARKQNAMDRLHEACKVTKP